MTAASGRCRWIMAGSASDKVNAPGGSDVPWWRVFKHRYEGASREEVDIIGLDLAKNVFQAQGAAADGAVIFRRKLLRA